MICKLSSPSYLQEDMLRVVLKKHLLYFYTKQALEQPSPSSVLPSSH